MKYTADNLQTLRCKFNSKVFSQSWLYKHFRGFANELYEIKKEQESNGRMELEKGKQAK